MSGNVGYRPDPEHPNYSRLPSFGEQQKANEARSPAATPPGSPTPTTRERTGSVSQENLSNTSLTSGPGASLKGHVANAPASPLIDQKADSAGQSVLHTGPKTSSMFSEHVQGLEQKANDARAEWGSANAAVKEAVKKDPPLPRDQLIRLSLKEVNLRTSYLEARLKFLMGATDSLDGNVKKGSLLHTQLTTFKSAILTTIKMLGQANEDRKALTTPLVVARSLPQPPPPHYQKIPVTFRAVVIKPAAPDTPGSPTSARRSPTPTSSPGASPPRSPTASPVVARRDLASTGAAISQYVSTAEIVARMGKSLSPTASPTGRPAPPPIPPRPTPPLEGRVTAGPPSGVRQSEPETPVSASVSAPLTPPRPAAADPKKVLEKQISDAKGLLQHYDSKISDVRKQIAGVGVSTKDGDYYRSALRQKLGALLAQKDKVNYVIRRTELQAKHESLEKALTKEYSTIKSQIDDLSRQKQDKSTKAQLKSLEAQLAGKLTEIQANQAAFKEARASLIAGLGLPKVPHGQAVGSLLSRYAEEGQRLSSPTIPLPAPARRPPSGASTAATAAPSTPAPVLSPEQQDRVSKTKETLAEYKAGFDKAIEMLRHIAADKRTNPDSPGLAAKEATWRTYAQTLQTAYVGLISGQPPEVQKAISEWQTANAQTIMTFNGVARSFH